MHGADALKIATEKTPDEKYNFNGRHFFSYEVKNNSWFSLIFNLTYKWILMYAILSSFKKYKKL